MKYLKVWTDFEKVLSPLNDGEVGRLFLAMLRYADTGEEPDGFAGNESFLWQVAKRDIDAMREKDEKLRQNGMKGGRPKTKGNQTEPNKTFGFDSEPNESLKEKKRNEIKINEISSSFLDDDEAHKIQQEQNTVIDAAEKAGFAATDYTRGRLVAMYVENGAQKMIDAIGQCAEHGATTLAYLQAVLTGKPKGMKPTKTVVAQQYGQRDYTDVQAELMEEQKREMDEFMKRGAG